MGMSSGARTAGAASLDYGNQVRVLTELRALAAHGIAVILSTHDRDAAFQCARVRAVAPIGPATSVHKEPLVNPAMKSVLAILLVLATAGVAAAEDLTFSVAISMKDAIADLGRAFMQRHPGTTLRYNFGSSGDLQKQIEAGAPVDLFVSAAARQMDELEKQQLIVAASRRVFAKNVLVAIAPANAGLDLSRPAALLDPKVTRIAVGNPKTVPAGQYTEESLRALGLWDRLQSKLVFAENVRQVLEYVSRGEVDAGFVYTTDAARRAGRIVEVFRPGEDTYRPVLYPVAVIAASKYQARSAGFIDLLLAPEGRAVLTRLGFQPPPPGAR